MISGFITTVASMPVDIAKTRIQNMKIVDGKPEYRGTLVRDTWGLCVCVCVCVCVRARTHHIGC